MPSILVPAAGDHPMPIPKPSDPFPSSSFGDDKPIPATIAPGGPSGTADDQFKPDSESLFPESDEELPLECMLSPIGLEADEDLLVPPPTGAPVKRGWVDVDSKWVHLESAVRLILGTKATEKSTDRLRRVCGFTKYPSTIAQSDSILGDLCLIGQLILALVRVNKEVALAAARVTAIHIGAARSPVESISLEHLSRPDVILTGQILRLDCRDGVWYWNKSFVSPASNGGKVPASGEN